MMLYIQERCFVDTMPRKMLFRAAMVECGCRAAYTLISFAVDTMITRILPCHYYTATMHDVSRAPHLSLSLSRSCIFGARALLVVFSHEHLHICLRRCDPDFPEALKYGKV